MKKIAFLLLILLVASGCEKEINNKVSEKDPKDFNLYEKIDVSSTNLPKNTQCLLFTSYPYNEYGALACEPVMVAYAPFEESVKIPKAVDKLYSYINGVVTEHARGDIALIATRSTRADNGFFPAEEGTTKDAGDWEYVTLSEAFITEIYGYYPEAQKNVEGDDLTVCTDIYAAEGAQFEETDVWITYVGCGGTTFSGDLWYYTYQVDANKKPITPFAEVKENLVQVFSQAHPNNEGPEEDTTGKRVYLGRFAQGTRIGFVYKGNSYEKYSTPFYNKENGYEEHTCGVVRIWESELDANQYATLGMENRLISEGEDKCDHDFNDMVCLIEANPICVENVIEPPVPNPSLIKWQGYWLFEDNYPLEGDYDFNDLVVRYAITETATEAIIDLQFVARGAVNSNSFGVNGDIYFSNLGGFVNVYAHEDKVEAGVRQLRLEKASDYIPMLNNGTTSFDLNTYNDKNDDFPCVLEIPVIDGSTFLWCLENKRIDAAYLRYKAWVDSKCTQDVDWYTDAPVEELVWNK